MRLPSVKGSVKVEKTSGSPDYRQEKLEVEVG